VLTGTDGGLAAALLLALFLGLRHATDPDHVAALAALSADPRNAGARPAGGLGLAWGLGHAVTCFLLGAAVVAFGQSLPESFRLGAEVVVGLLIVVLSLRLLGRWRRGRTRAGPAPVRTARSPAEAFGIGSVHGVGGSALAAGLLAAGNGDPWHAAALLGSFALGSIVAMAAGSAGIGLLIGHAPRRLAAERIAPLVGLATLSLGAWYTAEALGRFSGAA